jgi:hypothetical protein
MITAATLKQWVPNALKPSRGSTAARAASLKHDATLAAFAQFSREVYRTLDRHGERSMFVGELTKGGRNALPETTISLRPLRVGRDTVGIMNEIAALLRQYGLEGAVRVQYEFLDTRLVNSPSFMREAERAKADALDNTLIPASA